METIQEEERLRSERLSLAEDVGSCFEAISVYISNSTATKAQKENFGDLESLRKRVYRFSFTENNNVDRRNLYVLQLEWNGLKPKLFQEEEMAI